MIKSEKATWMAVRPQWYLASMGSTNMVQPYCRLATMAMQTIPVASWTQRCDPAPGEAAFVAGARSAEGSERIARPFPQQALT